MWQKKHAGTAVCTAISTDKRQLLVTILSVRKGLENEKS